jgi:UMF1 family MFS transporter
VILEQLARENGTFFSDRTKPCVESSGLRRRDKEQCMIEVLGTSMSTSSFAMYTFSAAVIVQAVVLVCISSFADHGMCNSSFVGIWLSSILWMLQS